jgi:hypothetical protein
VLVGEPDLRATTDTVINTSIVIVIATVRSIVSSEVGEVDIQRA